MLRFPLGFLNDADELLKLPSQYPHKLPERFRKTFMSLGWIFLGFEARKDPATHHWPFNSSMVDRVYHPSRALGGEWALATTINSRRLVSELVELERLGQHTLPRSVKPSWLLL
jgi:hypothetical protein